LELKEALDLKSQFTPEEWYSNHLLFSLALRREEERRGEEREGERERR